MKKHFLGIICLLYSGIIGYVWFNNKLKNYLAPQMQIYLKVSFFIILIIGIVILCSKEIEYKFKISDLILLLPVFMLVFAKDGRLTTSLVKNRMTNLNTNNQRVVNKNKVDNNEIMGPVKPNSDEIIDSNAENKVENDSYDMSNIYFKVIDEDYYDLANLITYTEKEEQYLNKTISVRGFVTRSLPFIPFGHFAIGKYGVSCCAADASFIGFFAKLDENIKLRIKNNEWYEIKGYLEPGKDNDDYNIMVIHVLEIKPIDGKKEEQYVYPCTSYKDGSCEELKKYDLEF